jgi:hypothetical protein
VKSEHFFVNGIVSQRNQQPYIQLSTEHGLITQLTMNEARQIAMDIIVQASRTEMDAMFLNFLKTELEAPEAAGAAALMGFRDYRAGLDDEKVEHDHRVPPKDEEEI